MQCLTIQMQCSALQMQYFANVVKMQCNYTVQMQSRCSILQMQCISVKIQCSAEERSTRKHRIIRSLSSARGGGLVQYEDIDDNAHYSTRHY